MATALNPDHDAARPAAALFPLNVLIVDDEVLIALDLAQTVEELGVTVLGPGFDVAEGFALVEGERAGAAFLDIDVGGEVVWPLARHLIRHGWAVSFISADPSYPELQHEFRSCGFINKPAGVGEIAAELKPLLALR